MMPATDRVLLDLSGLCFSPDPVSAHLATVAGNIIENAGGLV
jgi:glycolate oxidase